MELVFTPENGKSTTVEVYNFDDAGVCLAMYNTDESIRGFAHSSLQVTYFLL